MSFRHVPVLGRLLAAAAAFAIIVAALAPAGSLADEEAIQPPPRLVGASELGDLIAAALAGDDGDADALGVEFADPLLAVPVPAGSDDLVVEDVSRGRGGQSFAARIAARAGDETVRRQVVTGRVHHLSQVPVLTRPIGRDEVIAAADVEYVRLKDSRLGSSTIVDADDLVGLSARHALRAGVPVRASQVRQPVVVAKGSQVILVLDGPGLALSARGRALEDGGRGEVVRVSNLQSNIVVEGTVAGPGQVRVRPAERIATGARR
ncbi:MAG: flagellar basal body P-ring formation protein FlgA [Rhodospirillales bacterium]|nr:flagellar basal body P-ring formation protein FlgA [Rhodospirillales bacterium]